MHLDPAVVADQGIDHGPCLGHRDHLAEAAGGTEGQAEELELVRRDPRRLLARYKLALATPKPRISLIYDEPSKFFLALERWGYDIADGRAAIRAFQRRWRPRKIDGELDGEIGALLFELLLERDLGRARD